MVKYMVSVALASFVLSVVVLGNVVVANDVCVSGVTGCEVVLNGQLQDGILGRSLGSDIIDQQIGLQQASLKGLELDEIEDLALGEIHDGLPLQGDDTLGGLDNLTAQSELLTLSHLETL